MRLVDADVWVISSIVLLSTRGSYFSGDDGLGPFEMNAVGAGSLADELADFAAVFA